MVHPAVYAAIAVGGVVILGLKLYEEYLENRSYEQFQRNRTRYEQEYNRSHRGNNDFDFDDDREYGLTRDEDDDDPYTIRKRRPHAAMDSQANSDSNIKKSIHEDNRDEYELSELESSIAERKRRLVAEQAFLDQEEENLRNRKNALYQENDDVTSYSVNSLDSGDDNEGDSLQSHMAHFDPFADKFQETTTGTDNEHSFSSDSTQILIVDEATSLSQNSICNNSSNNSNDNNNRSNIDNGSNSTELRYPTPRTTTPSNSTTNSVSEGTPMTSPHIMSVSSNRGSVSEESWDAVSDAEWNRSSVYESDNEDNSQNSSASYSGDQ